MGFALKNPTPDPLPDEPGEGMLETAPPLSEVPAAEPSPEPPPARGGSFFLLLLAVVLAFGGGMLATVLYDRMVETPRRTAALPADAVKAAPAPPSADAPPSEPAPSPEEQRAAAIRDALAALRDRLSGAAIIDVRVRVDGGVVFLSGEVDTRATLVDVARVAGQVPGVLAVDTREIHIVSRFHEVAPGERLSDIARRYYGRADAWPRLVEANPGLNPRLLRAGQKIRVPSDRAP